MSDLREKVAYLQGLAEGLNLDEATKEGKMFIAIVNVLEDIVDELDELDGEQEELGEYIEAIDEDLGDLETEIFGEDEYPDEDDEDFEEWEEEEENYVEVECPQCHDIVRFECSILSDDDVIEVTCPNCNQVVYVNEEDFEIEEEDNE
jgi:phage FluMu protein Com